MPKATTFEAPTDATNTCTRWLWTGFVTLLLLTMSGTVSANTTKLTAQSVALRYDMIVLGTVISQPEVRLGAETPLNDGQTVRTMSVKAKTIGLTAKLYPLDNSLNTVLDAATLRPIRTQVRRLHRGEMRREKLVWGEGHLDITRNITGESGTRHEQESVVVDPDTRGGLGWLLWLQTLTLKKGESAQIPVHSGSYHMNVHVVAGGIETVLVPSGTYKARRYDIEFTRRQEGAANQSRGVAFTGKKNTLDEVSIWMSEDRYPVPIKLRINYKFIGDITMALRDRRVGS